MLGAMVRGIVSYALALVLFGVVLALAPGPIFAQGPDFAQGPAFAQGEVFPRARGPVVVVELFTSQSCPSCPEADEIAAELATHANLIVLSWPVDIWDYLGWEDTLASYENTRRQALYNGRFGLRWPYTPELVIDGREHLAGNQREDVLSRIEDIRRDSWNEVPIRMRMIEDRLVVNIGTAPEEMMDALGTLWLIPYRSHSGIEIGGGPNAGRTLSYVNVAEGYEPISQWAGSPVIVRHEIERELGDQPDGYVVLLQSRRTGPVIGAARLQVRWDGANR